MPGWLDMYYLHIYTQVAGFMHFWDLTIDVISCNTLVISIGLCVDFSAHIAHGFLSCRGSR